MRSNGCGLTRGPDNNTITYENERQPRDVKLMRVRRATARGSQDISARKAAGFSPELGGLRLDISRLPECCQNATGASHLQAISSI